MRKQTRSVLYVIPLLRWTARSLHCQLSDVTQGLSYLHSFDMIHGSLKGVGASRKVFPQFANRRYPSQANILIDDDRRARLADFGLSTITLGSTASSGGTLRWAAPEILDGGDRKSVV